MSHEPLDVARRLTTELASMVSVFSARHTNVTNTPLSTDIRQLVLKTIDLRRAIADLEYEAKR